MRILGRHDAHPRSTPRRQNRTAIDEQHAPRRRDPATGWNLSIRHGNTGHPRRRTRRLAVLHTANIPAGEAMAGWGNAAHNAARRSRQNVQPRPHTNLPCRAVTEREKNRLIDELPLKDQQLQQVDTISVNYIRQDNGAYPIWLRGECGYSAGTMPIQGQHLVAKTERQSTSNTRRDVVIQQPDGTSRYVMEILVTHAVEPDAGRSHNAANIPAGEAMAGWGNAAHNAARRSRQNVQPRPRINLPCRHGTRKESAHR